MESKVKKLINNSIIFAIGNFGSKVLSFIMIPLYTYSMTTTEYGQVDLLMTTVSLLLPVVTLSIYEAVLRFSMDKAYDPNRVLFNCLYLSLISSGVLTIGIVIAMIFHSLIVVLFIILLIVQIFQSLFSQYVRAIGKVKTFSANGILLTFLTAILNILLLVHVRMGVVGYLLSVILATLVSDLYLIVRGNIRKRIINQKVDNKLNKEMLVYSMPLIPNAIAWWLTSTSSRYFILFFIGAAANGIYAIANKIPTLLSVLNAIFFQSWQMSAIEEYDSKSKNEFYSKIFDYYFQFLFIGNSILIVILQPLMHKIVEKSYYSAWQYVPMLMIAVVYSSLSGFLGTNYTVAKRTQGIFLTTIYGAIINVVLNLILIPVMGLQGAGIGSAISYLTVLIIRFYNTKRFIRINLNYKNIIFNHVAWGAQLVVLYVVSGVNQYVIQGILFVVVLIVNRRIIIKPMYNLISKKSRKDN